jgi:hypothetical protein
MYGGNPQTKVLDTPIFQESTASKAPNATKAPTSKVPITINTKNTSKVEDTVDVDKNNIEYFDIVKLTYSNNELRIVNSIDYCEIEDTSIYKNRFMLCKKNIIDYDTNVERCYFWIVDNSTGSSTHRFAYDKTYDKLIQSYLNMLTYLAEKNDK